MYLKQKWLESYQIVDLQTGTSLSGLNTTSESVIHQGQGMFSPYTPSKFENEEGAGELRTVTYKLYTNDLEAEFKEDYQIIRVKDGKKFNIKKYTPYDPMDPLKVYYLEEVS